MNSGSSAIFPPHQSVLLTHPNARDFVQRDRLIFFPAPISIRSGVQESHQWASLADHSMHLSEGSTQAFPSLISPLFRFLDTPDARQSHTLPKHQNYLPELLRSRLWCFVSQDVDAVRTLFGVFLGALRRMI